MNAAMFIINLAWCVGNPQTIDSITCALKPREFTKIYRRHRERYLNANSQPVLGRLQILPPDRIELSQFRRQINRSITDNFLHVINNWVVALSRVFVVPKLQFQL